MRKLLFLSFIYFTCMADMSAQKSVRQNGKAFNFGIKAGLNAVLPHAASIDLQGMDIEHIRSMNNVGYTVELFGRFHINRFFIQPSASWKYARGEIKFDLVQSPLAWTFEPRITETTLHLDIKSIEIPVMLGYNLVNEAPYVLGIMAGPKLKYDYDIRYSSTWHSEHDENYYMSLCSIVEVIIGSLTFDFGYEYGLNNMRSTFDYMPNSIDRRPLRMKSKLNGLNMSIGLLF